MPKREMQPMPEEQAPEPLPLSAHIPDGFTAVSTVLATLPQIPGTVFEFVGALSELLPDFEIGE